MLISGLHPFTELKQTLSSLKNEEQRRKILGEVLSLLKNSQGSEWLADQWSNSELLWTDFLDLNEEPLDGFINMYKLDCLKDDCKFSIGVLARIVSILCSESIIADETFLAWRDSKEETEVQGRGTVMSALRSFFFSYRF
ncbi:hypothetical protein G9C98_006063 [Cotesia typhae]|uniref:Uncharacterized protein n=1 Tax=Cotesia typhae TaxID=2053667 RepID=A0A8J5QZU2_9HYME|nr:hypothetical protein G9C98_006063 [Cotesia typhae]